ncbi:DNA-directed RNA polymerase subunit beta [Striga asiatica]|uniref:DNA-directed RNA polymerase subunit beta n=1 Tax=Striga asiatica TaxID=4170 RepID=A0A5A7PPA6_STRAF|nr:DNA-directed RNA polymerase subunit beta [Striga asiatica]
MSAKVWLISEARKNSSLERGITRPAALLLPRLLDHNLKVIIRHVLLHLLHSHGRPHQRRAAVNYLHHLQIYDVVDALRNLPQPVAVPNDQSLEPLQNQATARPILQVQVLQLQKPQIPKLIFANFPNGPFKGIASQFKHLDWEV